MFRRNAYWDTDSFKNKLKEFIFPRPIIDQILSGGKRGLTWDDLRSIGGNWNEMRKELQNNPPFYSEALRARDDLRKMEETTQFGKQSAKKITNYFKRQKKRPGKDSSTVRPNAPPDVSNPMHHKYRADHSNSSADIEMKYPDLEIKRNYTGEKSYIWDITNTDQHKGRKYWYGKDQICDLSSSNPKYRAKRVVRVS
jgi:hypothetical protein